MWNRKLNEDSSNEKPPHITSPMKWQMKRLTKMFMVKFHEAMLSFSLKNDRKNSESSSEKIMAA